MDTATIKTRLNQVFRDTFDLPDLQISETTTAKDVAGWDSLTHIELIVAVEKEFCIKLTTREVMNLGNVGDLIAVVMKKAPQ